MLQKTLRIIHIDDEPSARAGFDKVVKEFIRDCTLIASASSVKTGIELLKSQSFDLLFLDLQMTDGSGFDLLDMFPEIASKTVLCTADDTRGIKAIKLGVFDYVVKPLSIREVQEVIDKFRRTDIKEVVLEPENLLPSDKIIIPDINGADLVALDEMLYLCSERNYTRIYFKDGSEKLVSKTLKYFDETLSKKGFLRLHKSILVNSKHIVRLHKENGGSVELFGGAKVELSQNGRSLLKNLLGI